MARKLVSFSCMAGSILLQVGVAWGETAPPPILPPCDPIDEDCTGGGIGHGGSNIACTSNAFCDNYLLCFDGYCHIQSSGNGDCHFTPTNCDDGVPCTEDSCDANSVCVHIDRNDTCNVDNEFCTDDFCEAATGICRQGTESPCTGSTPVCDWTNQRCVECTGNSDCAGSGEENQCDTGPGVCVECIGDANCADPQPFCNPATATCIECRENFDDCEDFIACTDESCHNNTCIRVDTCRGQDGLFCNGVEWCDNVVGAGTCLPGVDQCTAPGQSCDEIDNECIGCTVQDPCTPDAHACTTHTCDLSGGVGVCVVTTDDSVCVDDGLFCTGAEVCDAQLGCISEGDPCSDPTPICFEASDSCGNCTSDADCEDNIACTVDTCVNNLCQNTDDCEDGNLCNGIESCNPADGVCVDGDDVICTPELSYCLPESGTCVECVGGFDSTCDDVDSCTEDRCLLNNTCIHIPDSDGDGVPNCCDNCPDTIGTADIQCNGTWLNPGDPNCVCDNALDPTCPGGPLLEGCSCEQLDSDGDGLSDCKDNSPCP